MHKNAGSTIFEKGKIVHFIKAEFMAMMISQIRNIIFWEIFEVWKYTPRVESTSHNHFPYGSTAKINAWLNLL